jgi:hypothetical protein
MMMSSSESSCCVIGAFGGSGNNDPGFLPHWAFLLHPLLVSLIGESSLPLSVSARVFDWVCAGLSFRALEKGFVF